ncbi:MAG: class I SAM-dependent methyltransferase [Candidatus Parcubacteria bacterium]|nr:class I SAM-dependent methyltransferase [Burkholderiales bacterium]
MHAKALALLVAWRLGLRSATAEADPFAVFLAPEAHAINAARQEHLASLGLDLAGKSVLEVGAGIGLHTPFLVQRGCKVLVTDGNAENVAEIRRRHPDWRAEVLDLERGDDLRALGVFDVVYCYGLLYHLGNPEQAIARLAGACRGQILLETCVALGDASEVHLVRDPRSNNQAVQGIGCRPTRAWLMDRLRHHFGHAYTTRAQPAYPDFETDWKLPETRTIYRAVFVGSKVPLALPTLAADLPQRQAQLAGGVDSN